MTVKESRNPKSSIWDYHYIHSLTTPYLDEIYVERSNKLKGEVKVMLAQSNSTFDQLELLDVLTRLGISYHFKNEIAQITKLIYAQYFANKPNDNNEPFDLYATALKFRVLRENGHQVSQEIFRPFLNDNGDFESRLCKDIKGLLSLYEASYLSVEDESILDLAQKFCVGYLIESLATNECEDHLAVMVNHALDLPLNWRMQRLEAKWFIKMYQKMTSMNPVLLELAILDFNMVQAQYQQEIKELSEWYVGAGLAEKLPFARDRLFENFLWALAVCWEPQLEYCRKIFTKVAVLVLIVDDIYDEYGTLDDLQLFTDVINRWDISSVDHQLPDYMKICFVALFKCVNEVAYDISAEKGVDVIPSLQKMWAKICSSYLVEAKWLSRKYTPSLNEYLLNGWTTSTGPIIIVHMFLAKDLVQQEPLQRLEQLVDSIRAPSMIIRLLDDLRSSIAHGDKVDTPKAVECYMRDSGGSKEDAYVYIRGLINELWKQLNKNILSNNCSIIKEFNEIGKRFVRVAKCYGDAHATPESQVISLVARPIPLQ